MTDSSHDQSDDAPLGLGEIRQQVARLPHIEWRESLWFSYTFALDGAEVLQVFVNDKDQYHRFARRPLPDVLRDRSTPRRAKQWLRAQVRPDAIKAVL